MFFKEFPIIPYQFNIAGKKTLRMVRDITVNVKLSRELLDKLNYYSDYYIEDGETPERISDKVYGNAQYHWLIMLCNDKFDYSQDFPLSQESLRRYISAKYDTTLNAEVTAASSVITTEVPHGIAEGETIRFNFNSINSELQIDTDYIAEDVTPLSFKLLTNTGILLVFADTSVFELVLDNSPRQHYIFGRAHWENDDRQVVDADYPFARVVSNYEFEFRANETLRKIRLVNPRVLTQVVDELKELL